MYVCMYVCMYYVGVILTIFVHLRFLPPGYEGSCWSSRAGRRARKKGSAWIGCKQVHIVIHTYMFLLLCSSYIELQTPWKLKLELVISVHVHACI